jgi:GNAT superfamily N-acetyltransferase
MGGVSGVVFLACLAEASPACDLIDAMIGEVDARYQASLGVGEFPIDDLNPPRGLYLVGWDGDVPVAGGGMRRLDAETAEIRRMYVVHDRRGEGVGRQLLAALEDHAHRLGYQRLRLSTGPRQPEAVRLYQTSGYEPIPDYNGYAYTTFWGEKVLAA